MLNPILITIPGKPIHKARVKARRVGTFVQMYDSQDKVKKNCKKVMQVEYRGEPLSGPLRLRMLFICPRPKNHWGTGKNREKLKDAAPEFHTTKPDLDNYAKFYMDVANGILWNDDTQVVRLTASKTYTETAFDPGKTIIEVTQIDTGD
jgi:Holliday junction resolvase RusA-like endonuclease